MRLNKEKLILAMARTCKNAYDLCKETGIQYQTYNRAFNGSICKPATAGKIAKALNCDITELLETEEAAK